MKFININWTSDLGYSNIGELRTFADGESYFRLLESVRREDVLILGTMSRPASENLWRILMAIDACKRGGANRIIVGLPYFGYSRQDRRCEGREPISAKLVASMIEHAGATELFTVDIHSEQTLGFFNNLIVDNLYASEIICDEISTSVAVDAIVSPDVGGVRRARKYAEYFSNLYAGRNIELLIIDKRRSAANHSEVMNVIGHPAGLHCLVVDDIIDTGGTILKAAQSLLDKGALSVSIAATHGVFSMWEEFNAKAVRLGIRGIFTTNSVGTLHSPSDFGINSSVSLDPLIIHHIQKVEKCLQ